MQRWIEAELIAFVGSYAASRGTRTQWGTPVVAYADADDPLFQELKKRIGPSHAEPRDFLADARTVITYFVPLAEEIAEGNAEGRESSYEWALAYVETKEMMKELNEHLCAGLAQRGHPSATIPMVYNYDSERHMTDWSQRHAAYIAGLGTFGLNNMLITDRGCCGRVGSLVTSLKIEATPRPENERCLYLAKGTCGRCADRCVGSALSREEFDRFACFAVCLENAERYKAMGFIDVCGKCIVNVPCMFKNPVAKGLATEPE